MENTINNLENTTSEAVNSQDENKNMPSENLSVENKETSITDIIVTENPVKQTEETEQDFHLPNEDTELLDEEVIDTELAENDVISTSGDYSKLSKEDILSKLRYLIHETNVDDSRKEIEALKAQYYKNLKQEHEKIKQELKETTGNEVEIEKPKDDAEDYLKELLGDYRLKKAELANKQEEEKINNLKLKEEIIEKIKGLANSEESLNKTFAEFKSLQEEWINIGAVPNTEANALWKNYQLQIERFYDLVKINKELRDLDFKRNLEQKIELCEKAEELLISTDIIAAYKQLQEYHNLWKELGPVPHDKFKTRVMHGNILNGFISHFVGECLPSKDVIIHSQEIKYSHPVYLHDILELVAEVEDYFESVNTLEMKFYFQNQDCIKIAKGKLSIGLK